MNNVVTPIEDNTTDEQKVSHKNLNKKDYKALLIIQQCFYLYNFEKVGDVDSAKEA